MSSRSLYVGICVSFIIGFIIGFGDANKNPTSYSCGNNSIKDGECVRECTYNKRDCLEMCGCNSIQEGRKNVWGEGLAFGIGGIVVYALILAIKDAI